MPELHSDTSRRLGRLCGGSWTMPPLFSLIPRTWLPSPPSRIARWTCTLIGPSSTSPPLTPNRTSGRAPPLTATAPLLLSTESSPEVHDGSSLPPSSLPLVTPSRPTTLATSGPMWVTTPPAPAPYPLTTRSLTRQTMSYSTAPGSMITRPRPSALPLILPSSPPSLVVTVSPTSYGPPRPSSTHSLQISVPLTAFRRPRTRP
jgi:hypothetical protein